MTRPEFLFDVGSPYAWLAAERVADLFDAPPVWVPVLLGGIFRARGRSSWARTELRATGIAEIEERARERGLPAPRWPYPWPNDGLRAMRVAAYAEAVGAAEGFARAAFHVHFVEGHPLSEWYAIARAVSAAGLGREALDAPSDPEVKRRLRANTDRALGHGALGVPTVVVDGVAFWGDDELEAAAAAANSVYPSARWHRSDR